MWRSASLKIITLFIIIILISQFLAPVKAEGPINICTAPEDQCFASISGSYIVWQDDRNISRDIYMYNLETNSEMPITTSSEFCYGAAIQGDRIVWLEGHYQSSIMLYNITTGETTQLTTNLSGRPGALNIWGDIIVWESSGVGVSNDIYYYDIQKDNVTQLTNSEHAQCPDVCENYIVWFEYRNYQRHDIFMYNVATGEETQITDDGELQTLPSISGGKIVWVDYRNNDGMDESGDSDIYMYDIATGKETRLTYAQNHYGDPVISNDIVVWNRNDGMTGGIYAYDLSSGGETLLYTQTLFDYVNFFDFDQDKVVYTQYIDGDSNVYMIELQEFNTSLIFVLVMILIAVLSFIGFVWYAKKKQTIQN